MPTSSRIAHPTFQPTALAAASPPNRTPGAPLTQKESLELGERLYTIHLADQLTYRDVERLPESRIGFRTVLPAAALAKKIEAAKDLVHVARRSSDDNVHMNLDRYEESIANGDLAAADTYLQYTARVLLESDLPYEFVNGGFWTVGSAGMFANHAARYATVLVDGASQIALDPQHAPVPTPVSAPVGRVVAYAHMVRELDAAASEVLRWADNGADRLKRAGHDPHWNKLLGAMVDVRDAMRGADYVLAHRIAARSVTGVSGRMVVEPVWLNAAARAFGAGTESMRALHGSLSKLERTVRSIAAAVTNPSEASPS